MICNDPKITLAGDHHGVSDVNQKHRYLWSPFVPMIEVLPEARSGEYEINHFDLTEAQVQWERLRSVMNRSYGETRSLHPGRYCKLSHFPADNRNGETVIMSDTGMERSTNKTVVYKASGEVLLGGLGLGMIVIPLMANPRVCNITVVEHNPAVIELVQAPLERYLKAHDLTRVELHIQQGNIFEAERYRGRRFDTIYFDIWNSINGDHWEEMKLLRRKWRNMRAPGSWIDCWRADETRAQAKEWA